MWRWNDLIVNCKLDNFRGMLTAGACQFSVTRSACLMCSKTWCSMHAVEALDSRIVGMVCPPYVCVWVTASRPAQTVINFASQNYRDRVLGILLDDEYAAMIDIPLKRHHQYIAPCIES